MTSMPASRSARAITLAPRSCPSSPGLATSTRIFCSVMESFKHRMSDEGGAWGLRYPVCPCLSLPLIKLTQSQIANCKLEIENRKSYLPLHRLHIQTPPQIPARDRPVGFPAFRDFLHLHWFRHLSFAIVFANRRLDAVIACRQYIGTLQREHQEHVCRP